MSSVRPVRQSDGFSGLTPNSRTRNKEVDQVLSNVMKEVDREIRLFGQGGFCLTNVLGGATRRHGRQQPRSQRPSQPPIPMLWRRQPEAEAVGEASAGPPTEVDWTRTPHGVTVRRGAPQAATAVQVFDDTRVQLAYRTALWRHRAQRFQISLDMEDSALQEELGVEDGDPQPTASQDSK